MAKIPLRLYTREIENLINQGQTEEAIAHCRHILQTYPKYIEAYRLMGNAFLESQQFGEANDLFQRVLSVFPDDFIAHAGISIIREDEGNLEAATWHMERAFEAQPSNSAVQAELKRLYGRRDGIAPPKVRLTRGALVRMYAKGDLYHQAIAEIKAALKEDPNRLDLLTILARMYYSAGQKVDAAEICSNLLNKYPNCFEANKLLADILPETSRADDAEVYKERVIAIDPYYAQLSPTTSSIEEVPDNAVVIERFIYSSETAIRADQPQWASALGINIDETGQTINQTLPEWLSQTATPTLDGEANPSTATFPGTESKFTTQEEEFQNTTFPSDEQTIPSTDQDIFIPDFLKEAGWTPGTGNAEEQTGAFLSNDDDQELAPGDIPDWLQSIAREGSPEVDKANDDQSTSDLSAILDQAAKETSAKGEQNTISPTPIPPDDNFDWLANLNEPTSANGDTLQWSDELKTGDIAETSIVSSLSENGEEISTVLPSSQLPNEESDIAGEDKLPDWITGLVGETSPELTEQDTEDIPDWLKEIQPDAPDQKKPLITEQPEVTEEVPHVESLETESTDPTKNTTDQPVSGLTTPQEISAAIDISQPLDSVRTDISADELESTSTEEIPEWLLDFQQQKPEEEQPLPLSGQTNTPDWLSDLSKSAPVEEVLPPDTAQPAEEIPDWIKDLQPNDQQMETPVESMTDTGMPGSQTTLPSDSAVEQQAHEETPEWLKNLKEGSQTVTPVENNPPGTQDEIPDWLEKLPRTSETSISETISDEQISIPLDTQITESPDWSIEQDKVPGNEPKNLSEPVDESKSLVDKTSGEEEAALAWLEGLAAKHGADEETLYIPQDQRTDAPPDWVASMSDDNQSLSTNEFEIAPIIDQTEPSSLESASPLMDESEEQLTTELPDWLTSLQNEPQDITGEKETENPDELNASEIPLSVETFAEEIDRPVSENTPDWLEELQTESDFEADEQSSLSQDTTEQLPEWLTSTEDTPTAPIEENVTPQVENLQLDTSSELFSGEEAALAWLENLAAKHGADEETLYVPPEQRSETPPDWIMESMQEGTAEPENTSTLPPAEAEFNSLQGTDISQSKGPQIDEEIQSNITQLPDESVKMEMFETTETVDSKEDIAAAHEISETEVVSSAIQENPIEDTQPVKPYTTTTPESAKEELIAVLSTAPEAEQTPPEQLIPVEEFNFDRKASATPTAPVQSPDMDSATIDTKQLLNQGKISEALEIYTQMIQRGENLETVIKELNDSLYYYPVDISIWQSLGDAYLRANQIQDALNAYTKAEELLR